LSDNKADKHVSGQ